MTIQIYTQVYHQLSELPQVVQNSPTAQKMNVLAVVSFFAPYDPLVERDWSGLLAQYAIDNNFPISSCLRSIAHLIFMDFYEKDNLEAAQKFFTSHAEEGHPESQFRIALMFLNGKGVQKDLDKAFEWFQKAAEQNHPGALNCLGRLHETGTGTVPSNPELAVQCYEKSVALNYAHAKDNLARCLFYGSGCGQDIDRSISLYESIATSAVPTTSASALRNYAHILGHIGPPDKKNLEKSITLYQTAIEIWNCEIESEKDQTAKDKLLAAKERAQKEMGSVHQ